MDGQPPLAKLRLENEKLRRHIQVLEGEKAALEEAAQKHVRNVDSFKQQAEGWKRAWQDLQAILDAQSRKRKRGEQAKLPSTDNDMSKLRGYEPYSNVSTVSMPAVSALEAQASVPRVPAAVTAPAKDPDANSLLRRHAMNAVRTTHQSTTRSSRESIHETAPAPASKAVGSNPAGRPKRAPPVERGNRSGIREPARSEDKKPEKRYPPLAPTVIGAGLRDADLPMMFRTLQNPLFGQRGEGHGGFERYEEVVRDRTVRKSMHGSDCWCCSNFYASKRETFMREFDGDERKVKEAMEQYVQKGTRHRTLNMPSEAQDECRTIGIPGDSQFFA